MADIFANIAQGITAPIGGVIRGAARGMFPGAAKAADVKYETIKRQKDMQQLQLMISMMKDPGINQKDKTAASQSARRILFKYHPEWEQAFGGGPMVQRRDWWSGLVAPTAGGIGTDETARKQPAVSPFRVETIAGKPGEAEPTVTLKPTAMSPADRQAFGTKLRTEFNALSKDFRVVRDSYGRVLASAEDPSAAGDLALIFNYMKMLDPGSVVRESEFANAAASGSLGQRWIAVGRKLLAGERLSPQMRADFLDRSHRLFKSQKNIQNRLIRRYSGLAKRSGISEKDVITEIEMRQPSKTKDITKMTDEELKKLAGIK